MAKNSMELSPAEKETLIFVLAGYSNVQIAKSHSVTTLRRLRQRLGLESFGNRNLFPLVIAAMRDGLPAPDLEVNDRCKQVFKEAIKIVLEDGAIAKAKQQIGALLAAVLCE